MKKKSYIGVAAAAVILAAALIPVTVYSRSSGSVIYAGKTDLPSAPAVTLLTGGNFFMNLNLTQTVTEEGENYTVTGNLVVAGQDGKLFTCNTLNTMGMDVQLTRVFDGTRCWDVDLTAKTYSESSQTSEAEILCALQFIGQGRATVNGQEMIYDRYVSPSGETVTFFIQNGKIAVLGMEAEGEQSYFSVMELRSEVPDGLLFDIPADYKQVEAPDPFGTGDMVDNYVGDIEDYLSDEELKDLQDIFGEDFDPNDLMGGDVDLGDLMGDYLEDIYGDPDLGALIGGEQ